MKKILFAIMSVAIAVGLMGAAFAYFSDTETSTGNTFTAGTLDLKVDDDPDGGVHWVDDPNFSALVSEAAGNLAPGDSEDLTIGIYNDGSIDGNASIKFIVTANDDNGINEPESKVDTSDGAGNGELAQNIKIAIDYNGSYLTDYGIADGKTLKGIDGIEIPLGVCPTNKL